jgi:DNA-binding transcriptional regulator YiaG
MRVDPLAYVGWMVALVVLILIAVGVVALVRKSLRDDAQADDVTTFSMGDIRKLRDEGRLTQAEFDAMKQAVIDRTKSSLAAGEGARGRRKS